MANTTSLAKAASSPAKNVGPKVVKLAKARASRNGSQAKLNPVQIKKTERSMRSSKGTAEVAAKSKQSSKAAENKAVKARQPKETAKRPATNGTSAKSRSSTVSAMSASTLKVAGQKKSAPHPVLVQTVETRGKLRVADPALRLPEHTRPTERKLDLDSSVPKLSPEDIKVFQIFYLPDQQPHLDPDFTAYDNSGNTSRLFEFSVFTKLAQSEEVKTAKLWGAMSWKFSKKAGISGRQLKEEIIAHPGYDAYYCNPYPENEALFHNMWLQGELAHPNFMPLCTEIFEVAGLPTALLSSVQPSSDFAAANYFVANQAFWRAYIGFVSRVLISADKNLSPTAKRIFYSSTADKFGAHAEASYIPFLVERLFTVFLRTEGRKFKTFKLPLAGREKKDNVHLRLLTEMKDMACRSKSMWLAACWINYRTLYLSKIYGESWTKNHLKKVTPTSITFMPDATN
jgi:hypothetical protein